ncbi:MAG: hypothetical protein Q9191_000476 [Dirinaria sp. TL-2023a]
MAAYIEWAIGSLTSGFKGHDAKLFTKGPAFADFPNPTLELSCPECGPSGSSMKLHHSQDGAEKAKDRFLELSWRRVEGAKEYILLCEDADLPVPAVIFHGLFYAIPPTTTAVAAADMDLMEGEDGQVKGSNALVVKAGFRCIKNIQGSHYTGPKPLLNHGPHRYFYQLVALKEPVDLEKLGPKVTKDGLGAAIVGKVIGWGEWVGVYERKWE